MFKQKLFVLGLVMVASSLSNAFAEENLITNINKDPDPVITACYQTLAQETEPVVVANLQACVQGFHDANFDLITSSCKNPMAIVHDETKPEEVKTCILRILNQPGL